MENAGKKAMWPALASTELVAELRTFVAERITPFAHDIDERDVYPSEIVRDLASRGYNVITSP